MLTVRRALKIAGLAESKLVAGSQGLDNEICSVDIIEVPDFHDWVTPKELGVTSGYAVMGNPKAQKRLVRVMADKGAAALAVKPDRFLKGSMPKVMIDAANEAGFPLIEIPSRIPYTQITLPIISMILNEQVAQLQYESSVRGMLQKCVIDDQDVQSIAKTVARIVGSPAAVFDQNGHLLGASHQHLGTSFTRDRFAQIPRLLCEERREGRSSCTKGRVWHEGFLCIPAYGRGNILGYLVVELPNQDALNHFGEIALKEAMAVVALELTNRCMVQEAVVAARSTLLLEHNFLQSTIMDKVQDKGELSEASFGKPYVVVVATFRQKEGVDCASKKASMAERLARMLTRLHNSETSGRFLAFKNLGKEELILLYPVIDCIDQDRLSMYTIQDLHHLRKTMCSTVDLDVVLGVSRIHTGKDGLLSAVEEARRAVVVGALPLGIDGLLLSQDMMVHELLDSMPKKALIQYAVDNLGLLLEVPEKEELFKTLSIYLQCGGQVSEAARRLYVHRNTLSYRLDKIGTLLKCNVREPKDQFRLWLALVAGSLSDVIPKQ